MAEVCQICGVPLIVSSGLKWDSNGTIVLPTAPLNRMVFYESDLIDDLFHGIEKIIGISIRHLVVESRRRDTRKFMEAAFADQIKKMRQTRTLRKSRQVLDTIKAVTLMAGEISIAYGYGKTGLSDKWEKGEDYPWRYPSIANPHSIYLNAGDILGTVEAFDQQDLRIDYREVEDNVYALSIYPGKHLVALKDRFRKKLYQFKPGEIEYEVCPGCGIPLEVAACHWKLEEGTIQDNTGRRMAILEPGVIDSVLEDLEQELGDSLPGAVIEVMRLRLKDFVSDEYWRQGGLDINRLIALRGLGNLVRFDADRDSLDMTIENACLPLLMVGTAQGLFELVTRMQTSSCEWSMSEEGDLDIKVGPGQG